MAVADAAALAAVLAAGVINLRLPTAVMPLPTALPPLCLPLPPTDCRSLAREATAASSALSSSIVYQYTIRRDSMGQ